MKKTLQMSKMLCVMLLVMLMASCVMAPGTYYADEEAPIVYGSAYDGPPPVVPVGYEVVSWTPVVVDNVVVIDCVDGHGYHHREHWRDERGRMMRPNDVRAWQRSHSYNPRTGFHKPAGNKRIDRQPKFNPDSNSHGPRVKQGSEVRHPTPPPKQHVERTVKGSSSNKGGSSKSDSGGDKKKHH